VKGAVEFQAWGSNSSTLDQTEYIKQEKYDEKKGSFQYMIPRLRLDYKIAYCDRTALDGQ
jgi:hypothetical protein